MSIVSNISKGMQLIEQYEEDCIFSSDVDQIWCGQGNGKSVTEITDEGKAILEGMGWFIDESLGCWSFLLV